MQEIVVQGPRSATQATVARIQAAQAVQEARMQLVFKQTELRDQLKELSRRRNELLEQRQGASPPAATDINARIAVIDARSAQLEKQLFATNDAIAGGYGGPGPATSQTEPQLAEAVASQITQATQEQVIRRAVNAAVEDAVFGSFAAAVTTLLAFYVAWRGFRRFIWKPKFAPAALPENSAQIEKLQQSMDVIAIEVERISEAQRYTAKLMSERGLGAGDAPYVPANQRDASRVR
jgi:hypothetical protein